MRSRCRRNRSAQRLGVLPGLDGPELRGLLVEHDGSMSSACEERQQILPCFGDELVGKEIPIADDDGEGALGHVMPLGFRANTPNCVGVGRGDELAVDGLFLGLPVDPVVM